MIRTLLGTYAAPVAVDTFLHKERAAESRELAKLPGIRLATAVEPDRGSQLSDGIIKQLTGKDPVAARKLYNEPFDFMPAFKIWIAANHRPNVVDMSYGFWRRVLLVPFNVQFEGANKDETIDEKLLPELPGILNWALEGCQKWQGDGLKRPAAVSSATTEYQEDANPLSGFLADACVREPGRKVHLNDLYKAYIDYARGSGDEIMTKIMFGKLMDRSGFHQKKSNGHKYWGGIGLKGRD